MALWIREVKRKDGSIRKVWYGDVFVPTGKRYSNGKVKYKKHTFSIGDVDALSERKAENRYNEIKQQILQEEDTGLSDDPTLSEISREYVKHAKEGRKKSSWWRDELALRLYSEFADPNTLLSETNIITVDKYKAHRLKKVSKSTLKRDLESIRAMYNQAIKWDKFKGPNPVTEAGIDKVKPNPRRVLSDKEETLLFQNAERTHWRIWAQIRLTGMRPAEVVMLKKDRVRFDLKRIRLTPEDTKNDEGRDIVISSVLEKILVESLENNNSEYVNLNTQGKPYTDSYGPMKALRRLRRKLGLADDVTQYSLRHTYATKLLLEKVDLRTVQITLGHSSSKTTELYTHPFEEAKTRAASIAGDQFSDLLEENILHTNLRTKGKSKKATKKKLA